MPTIFRADGFEVMIYLNDHRPEHVHVYNADGLAVINLHASPEAMELRKVVGMRKKDVRRAWDIVADNHEAFLSTWRRIHG